MSLPAEAVPPDPTVDAAAYRRAVGHFASGVTVCTSRVGGTDHAMTASAFTSVSLDPLLVLVCVDKEARFRDAVLESGTWAVSILPASRRLVRHEGPAADRPDGPLPAPPRHHRRTAPGQRRVLAGVPDPGGLRRRRPRHRARRGARRRRGRPRRGAPGPPPGSLRPVRLTCSVPSP